HTTQLGPRQLLPTKFDSTMRRPCALCPYGLSSSSSSLESGDFTPLMQSVLSVIKRCGCTTIKPGDDIYSPMHTRAHCTKDRVTARTIWRRSNALVQACWRSSTLARTKINTLNCQNPWSWKAKQVQ